MIQKNFVGLRKKWPSFIPVTKAGNRASALKELFL
jgi:hypothetical protein